MCAPPPSSFCIAPEAEDKGRMVSLLPPVTLGDNLRTQALTVKRKNRIGYGLFSIFIGGELAGKKRFVTHTLSLVFYQNKHSNDSEVNRSEIAVADTKIVTITTLHHNNPVPHQKKSRAKGGGSPIGLGGRRAPTQPASNQQTHAHVRTYTHATGQTEWRKSGVPLLTLQASTRAAGAQGAVLVTALVPPRRLVLVLTLRLALP